MGAGASASLSAALQANSEEDLKAALQGAAPEDQTKVASVVRMMGRMIMKQDDIVARYMSPVSRNRLGVPMLGFGTYQLSEEEAEIAVAEALKAGFRHIDTAQAYDNEAGIGRAIEASGIGREEIFVTSKVSPGYAAWGEAEKSFKDIVQACKVSLRKLKLTYFDLYLLEAPLSSTRLEQYAALVNLKFWGIVKRVGVSNFNQTHFEEIENAGLPMPLVNQLEFHPLCQQREVLEYMKAKGIAPIGYSALATLSTWRSAEGQRGEAAADLTKACREITGPIAKRLGVTEAKLMLCWVVQRGLPVLVKSCNSSRIQDNADVFQLVIPDEDMSAIAALDQDHGVSWAAAGINPIKVEVSLDARSTPAELEKLANSVLRIIPG